MKKLMLGCLAAGLSFSISVLASDTANQTVTLSVSAINEIAVSGNPAALTVNSATAGSAPIAATDSSTTYAITSNESNKKITAQVDSDLPAGTALTVALAAPTGASSTGPVNLSTVPVDAVTGISQLNESGKSISYSFSATAAAGTVESTTRTVTFTVTN